MVYKSFILPLFDYCDTVWTCCNKGDADRLERLQNRAAKTVYECNCSEIAIDALRWGPLSKRRDLHVFKLVKKSLMNTVPQFLMNYFTFNRDITSRTTRQSNVLHLPKVKTESAKKSFYFNDVLFIIHLVYLTFLLSNDTWYITKHLFTGTSENSMSCGPLDHRLSPSASVWVTRTVSGPQNTPISLPVNKH